MDSNSLQTLFPCPRQSLNTLENTIINSGNLIATKEAAHLIHNNTAEPLYEKWNLDHT